MKRVFPVFGLSTLVAACSSPPQETVALSESITVQAGSGRIYMQSLGEGIIDLHYLAPTAENEDAWVWTGNYWVDVGIKETPATVDLDIGLILETVAGLQKGATLYDYHIHPKTIHPHPPSIIDFRSYEYLKLRLSEQDIRSKSFVIDGHGVWEYAVAENAEYAACYYSANGDEENILEPVLVTKEKINTFIAEMNKCGISLKYYFIE